MIADVAFHPLVQPWLVAALVVPGVALLAVALWRRARGATFRALVLLVLAAAMLDPRSVREERRPQPDVALIVVDESASERIGGRADAAEAARAGLEERLGRIEGIEVRTVRAGGDRTDETRLFGAIEHAAREDATGRLAAVFVISDGQVHDAPQPGEAPWLTAPMHLLLTGRPGERDRRVVVDQAPAWGLVDQQVSVGFHVDDVGIAAGDEASTEVRFRVDGEDAGGMQVRAGRPETFDLPIRHPGQSVLEIEAAPAPGELSVLNNRTAVVVNGVRERLKVLLVSGQPHQGERTWRNLLKSDPAVDLVHFTILRPPEKEDATPLKELSLIVFPVQELFESKLYDFDLVVLDRYVMRSILPQSYYTRIAEYVRQGGALLVSVGPEFAGPQSLFRTPLESILPAGPTGRVFEQAFRPEVTEIGRRHPVTARLPGAGTGSDPDGERAAGAQPGGTTADGQPTSEQPTPDQPTWGRWFRLVETEATAGTTVMTGIDGAPLLIVDRVGDGRVAELTSDQIWLWARGFEGGGPQAELLRRLAHWLTKEPELEEEHLSARIVDGRLEIERRSVEASTFDVRVTSPDGEVRELALQADGDGIAKASLPAAGTGLWRVADGALATLAASGRLDPPELADMRADPDRLAPLVEATRGGTVWLNDGLPDLRWTSVGQSAAGRGWLGLQRNRAYTVTGVVETPLLPALVLLAGVLGGLVGAWWREGR